MFVQKMCFIKVISICIVVISAVTLLNILHNFRYVTLSFKVSTVAALSKLDYALPLKLRGDISESVPECRYVYLDLGSNKGVQVRKLFQPDLYPNAPIIPIFDEVFGNVSERRKYACAFGFEANPRHMQRLKYIEKAYINKGFRVEFQNFAVSDKDNETVTIFSETNFELDWGAGLTDAAIHNKSEMTKYKVPTLDIVRFIEERIVPMKAKAVFMKMDIEGSEYKVLPHVYKNNILCRNITTSIGVEVHVWAQRPMNSSLDIFKLLQDLEKQSCAQTNLHWLDDETYNMDVETAPDA